MTADSWLEENCAAGQIAVTHALDVLRRTPSGVRVLGADGFTGVNHPTLELIADFSRSTMTPEESVATAIDTLASWPTDILVELVVSDD